MRGIALPVLLIVSACSSSPDDPDVGPSGSGGKASQSSGGSSSTGTGGSTATGGSGNGGSNTGGSTATGGVTTSGGAGASGSAAAGNGGNGGAAAGASSNGGAPPIVIQDCDALPTAGTFENILPDDTEPHSLGIDPVNAGTVYMGTYNKGILKTTNCGGDWTHINTGTNGAALDSGRNWTLVVDPIEPETLYTNAGYGTNTNRAYKSTNGGVDWSEVWPPPDGTLADIVQYNFANVFAIDPENHEHLLLSFHAVCAAPYTESCIGETTDGGETWQLVNGDPAMVGTEGQVVYFLDTPQTWLWGSSSSDFWRTENGGDSWTKIAPAIKEAHPQGSQLYRAADGTFYLAASDGIARSTDGKAWSLIPGTNPLGGGIVGDGTTMYMSNSYYWDWGTTLHPYFTAPENAGTPWTQMSDVPDMTAGGALALDVSHHVLYSSTLGSGFWRVVVE